MPPVWLQVGLGLLGLYQTYQQQQAQSQALAAAQSGGISDEEIAALKTDLTGQLKTDLAGRGLLDSGLLPGGIAKIGSELALAKIKGKLPFQGAYINALMQKSQSPTLLSSLIPLLMQYYNQPGTQQAASPITVSA